MYGVLKSNSNTGVDSDLQYIFATPLNIKSIQPAYIQDSLNLKRKASSQNVQRWEIEANVAQTNDKAEYLVHSVVNGHDKVIYVRMPQVYGITLSDASVDWRVVNAWVAGQNQIQTGYWTGTVLAQLQLKVGEFIRFASHSKVYLVTDIGTGPATATIHPPLVAAVANSEVITVNTKVTMNGYYNTETQLGIRYVDGVLSDPGSINIVEEV